MSFLSRFWHGGVHPPEHKDATNFVRIHRLPFPNEVVLPLNQHFGAPAKPLVAAGDRVERGDKIAEADGFISSTIHASCTGTVADVGLWPHPNGSFAEAIRITVDPYSAQAPRPRMVPDWHGLTREEIVAAVQEAGVVGLGGAAFPAHVKLQPPPDCNIDVLLLNGCECEPYLTTDHRTMAEIPDRVHDGIRIVLHCLGLERAIVGIEQNKPDAIEAMRAAAPEDLDIEIVPLRVKYPQGAEKMLIKAVLDREVPSGKLPLHIGVVTQNVGSIAAIAEVFETGLPLVERILTVTGPGVRKPGNFITPIGTKVRDLIEACGGLTPDACEIVNGGPMMGASQGNLDTPIVKGSSGLVVLTSREVKARQSYPCIRCGHCLDACPVYLNPQHLGQLAEAQRYDEMVAHHLMDCMLCGCCSYVCPSNIPLSQLFSVSKATLARNKARS